MITLVSTEFLVQFNSEKKSIMQRNSIQEQEIQPSLTNRATHLCKCNGVADLLKHASPHCVTTPNLVVLH